MEISSIGGSLPTTLPSSAYTGTTGGNSFESLLAAASGSTTGTTADATKPKITAPLTPEQRLTKLKDALAAFEQEAKMTPAQRARRAVLKNMDLTEGALDAMPPAEREATEQKIAVAVAKLLRLDKPLRTDHAASGIDPSALLTPAAREGLA